MKVLLVDDEDNLRRLLRITLRSAGFEVLEAANGFDALELSENHRIDLLVTDVVMGAMDGLALAHSLVDRQPELPVVYISGFPLDFEAERRRLPRCAFVPKPFPPKVLLNIVASFAGAPQ